MNKILKKTLVLLLIFVVSLGLIGCSNNSDKNSTNSSKDEAIEEVKYPLTITDSFDKEVTLKSEPKKIISVAPNITEIIYELGAEDKLIGRTDYCDYPVEVEEIESIGTLSTPDVEKIISLEPDLVIASTHFKEENATKLEEAGIKVIGLYEENDVNGVYTIIETLGKALNKLEKANEIVKEMKATISEVTDKISGLEQPTVYYVVSYGESGDYSAPANTFVGQLIKLAGGKNIVPESDSWSYSIESLLEADPKMIIVRKGDKEGFMSTDAYKELTAVKEGNIYEIDNNLLDRQGYRNSEGVLELANIFYPETFK